MTTAINSESTIWSRLIEPDAGDLEASAARFFLKLDFSDSDRERMNELAAKARAGTLSAKEHAEIASYNQVGHALALLQSKARRSLKMSAAEAR
jgi:hypothetical protein